MKFAVKYTSSNMFSCRTYTVSIANILTHKLIINYYYKKIKYQYINKNNKQMTIEKDYKY
jgi:hypothetical protein